MAWTFGPDTTHYNYNSYDRATSFSSNKPIYDDYFWFVETCEDYGAEPECYED